MAGVAEHRLTRFWATEGCGCAHTHQLLTWALEAITQTADQTGQIRALGTVKAVELIDNQIAQNTAAIKLAPVVLPQALHMGLDEQVVELLVIGKQDVGRRLVQSLLIGDHAGGGHRRCGRVIGGADVEPSAQTRQGRNGVDQTGDTP